MSILQKMGGNMAYGKVGILGFAGSGKTFTASLIATGLHRMIGSTKPVGFFDTETGSAFVEPKFSAAGIELVGVRSARFADLISFLEEAEGACDIVIIDSISHIWKDVQETMIRDINAKRAKWGRDARSKTPITRLEFQHWAAIKQQWGQFTDLFLNSKLHVIVCGRAGYEYDFEEDEGGRKELVKTGKKMKAEGEFGYEPSLVIEMDKISAATGKKDRVNSGRRVINTAFVLKDRWDLLDGQSFENPTFETFAPHFAKLNLGGEHHAVDGKGSEGMFEGGSNDWAKEKAARDVTLAEIVAFLEEKFPGRSDDAKTQRRELIKSHFGCRTPQALAQMESSTLMAGFHDMQNDDDPLPFDAVEEESQEEVTQ